MASAYGPVCRIDMDTYSNEDLNEALRVINSLISKCEKVQEKIRQGTSQSTLLNNRIKAFHISISLITKALEDQADPCLKELM